MNGWVISRDGRTYYDADEVPPGVGQKHLAQAWHAPGQLTPDEVS